MLYFLVKGKITHTPYMGNDVEFEDVRLVLASDQCQARKKYEHYWDGRSVSYSDSYWVRDCDVQDTPV